MESPSLMPYAKRSRVLAKNSVIVARVLKLEPIFELK